MLPNSNLYSDRRAARSEGLRNTRQASILISMSIHPYTRGKERSRTSASVLAEARRIADQGYTEIQLLGQNVNSYRDPEGKLSFAEQHFADQNAH